MNHRKPASHNKDPQVIYTKHPFQKYKKNEID